MKCFFDRKILFFLILLSAFAAAAPQIYAQVSQQQKSANIYNLKISLADPPNVEIEAEVEIKDGRLLMIGGAVNHLPRGWATFVRDLKVTDVSGNALKLEEFSDEKYKTQWKIGNGYKGRARLSYKVDLSFAKTKWGAGNEQAAFYDGKALFAASRVFFIVPEAAAEAAEVRFDLPANAKLAVPWKLSADGRSYAMSGEDLLYNTLVAGDFGGFRAREGNFDFTVALLGKAREAEPLVSSTLSKYARMYNELFGEMPPTSYLMTLFYADAEDGEAYNQSAAFTTAAPLTEENLIMSGNTLGHELFHYWCGRQISGEIYEESQWFQEGFTEYYANLALMRERILPERFFIWKVENILGKYLYFRTAPQFSEISIKNSGEKKTTYRFGVYDGGWAVAFALDMEIREKTAGRKSLDDFMRLMYRKFGATKIKYKYADLVSAASETAGSDMTDFFKRYVEGKEVLPVAALLEKIGYGSAIEDYAGEVYIFPLKPTPLKASWLKLNEN
jgi:predicted metalloprotease with PDZ domain